MDSGTFSLGCNYWASHAGMMMWRDWKPGFVSEDLKQLAENGLQILRVFPLWPDFQPLQQIYGGGGAKEDLQLGDKRIGSVDTTDAGIPQDAIEKFIYLADCAEREGLKLIVGLVTGWMSGRLFVPPAFEGLNVLTDPLVLKWQSRFVKTFVNKLKYHPAILAWDLGNECNCMAPIDHADQAWVWTELIAGSIRQTDPTRPIVSGMHSLQVNTKTSWRISDQGELTNFLTTHPYPIFTKHCDQDPVNELRNGFHATAECRLYADIAKRPCFAEELGTLGPMVASDTIAAEYIRSTLFTLWAHDCRAMLWWCAYDQNHLEFPPYDQNDCERKLGLIENNRKEKPVLKAISKFRKEIDSLPFSELPPCKREAVCLLTEGQDSWSAAYSCYILAKQAGFDISFQHIDSPLIDSELYLLPSINGFRNLDHKTRNALREKIHSGSSLYVSFGDAFFEPFEEFFGLNVTCRERSINNEISFNGLPGTPTLHAENKFRLVAEATTAQILAKEDNGAIAFSCNKYGNGKVYYLSFPMEEMLSNTPGVFHGKTMSEYYRIYQYIGLDLIGKRLVRQDNPSVTITEHDFGDGRIAAVIINHSSHKTSTVLQVASGISIDKALIGEISALSEVALKANDAIVLLLKKS